MEVLTTEDRLASLEKVSSARDIALLRIRSLEEDPCRCGFAATFVPLLRFAFYTWLKSVTIWNKTRRESRSVLEEKKEAIVCSSDLSNISFHISGTVETKTLLRLLQTHLTISRLDPTLGEELGREGSHAVLLRLIRCDEIPSNFEEDKDALMGLQDLACDIASRTSTFPLKVAPFSLDELRSRLPLAFEIIPSSVIAPSVKKNGIILIQQVTARQSAQEDVGFVMWPSAVALARWIATHHAIVRGSTVLELGAGCGLVGLAAAKLDAKQVIMTDYNPTVLENLRCNINLNDLEDIAIAEKLDFYQQTGQAEGWLCGDGNVREQVDVVLAADVICQPADALASANAIHDALRPGGIALVVCADSNHRFGIERFEEEVEQVGLNVSVYNVADHDGRLLQRGMELTTGFVEGMILKMFEIEKPPNR